MSDHARLPLHRIKVNWLFLHPVVADSNFEHCSTGMEASGNRFHFVRSDSPCSWGTTVRRVRRQSPLKLRSPSTTRMVHIRSESCIVSAVNLQADTYTPTNFFAHHGSLQVSLAPGLLSPSQFSSISTTSLYKGRQRLMTFTTRWCTKRTTLVSIHLP